MRLAVDGVALMDPASRSLGVLGVPFLAARLLAVGCIVKGVYRSRVSWEVTSYILDLVLNDPTVE